MKFARIIGSPEFSVDIECPVNSEGNVRENIGRHTTCRCLIRC